MKKLMIAAAAVAMTAGAFAEEYENPIVYNVKMSLKTLAVKELNCGRTPGSDCTICHEATSGHVNYSYYLENGTRKVEGLIVSCSPCLDTVGGDNSLYLFWDKTFRTPISGLIDDDDETIGAAMMNHYPWFVDASDIEFGHIKEYDANPVGSYTFVTNAIDETEVETNKYYWAKYNAAVYGKKQNKVAVKLGLNYKTPVVLPDLVSELGVPPFIVDMPASFWTLDAVGFGSWDNRNLRIKSVSGNVVGDIPLYDYALILKGYGICFEADYCEGDGYITNHAPACGTFTMKLNMNAAKKELYKSVPDYMLYN